MRRFLACASISAVAALGMIVAWPAPQPADAVASATRSATPEDGWSHFSWYNTEAECLTAGAAGERAGRWTDWFCLPRPGVPWIIDLYVYNP